jgi:hypothetical protein
VNSERPGHANLELTLLIERINRGLGLWGPWPPHRLYVHQTPLILLPYWSIRLSQELPKMSKEGGRGGRSPLCSILSLLSRRCQSHPALRGGRPRAGCSRQRISHCARGGTGGRGPPCRSHSGWVTFCLPDVDLGSGRRARAGCRTIAMSSTVPGCSSSLAAEEDASIFFTG